MSMLAKLDAWLSSRPKEKLPSAFDCATLGEIQYP